MASKIELSDAIKLAGMVEEWGRVYREGATENGNTFILTVYRGIANGVEVNIGRWAERTTYGFTRLNNFRIFGRRVSDPSTLFDYGDREIRRLYLEIEKDPRTNRIPCNQHDQSI